MTKKAKAIDAITILTAGTLPDGVKYLEAACADYDAYSALPQAVECDGRVYGKTGWDSDKCLAFYRTDARIAFAIR